MSRNSEHTSAKTSLKQTEENSSMQNALSSTIQITYEAGLIHKMKWKNAVISL
jgi:hypothetical protein